MKLQSNLPVAISYQLSAIDLLSSKNCRIIPLFSNAQKLNVKQNSWFVFSLQTFNHVIDLQNMTIKNEQIEDTAYTIYDINANDNSYKVTTYASSRSSHIDRINSIA